MNQLFAKVIRMDIQAKPTASDLAVRFVIAGCENQPDGLVEENTINILAAPSFTGKSWVALAMAKCANDPSYKFLGFGTDVEQPVLYLDKEMGETQFKKRWLQMGWEWNATSTFHYLDLTGEAFDLSSREYAVQVRDYCEEHNIALVVVDSLGSSAGGAEENSNSGMLRLMDNIKVLKNVTSVMLIHHTGKMAKKDDLDQKCLRGATAIGDQADNIFFINNLGDTHRGLRESKRRIKGRTEDYLFNMEFGPEGKVGFRLEEGQKATSADYQNIINVLSGLAPGSSSNALKKALRQAGMTIRNDDFNPLLERMERDELINIDKTSGRGWKITTTDHGAQLFGACDPITGEPDANLNEPDEVEELKECEVCGHTTCECDED